ncbi:MAG: 50S ribosomal protein L4 [Anaerolineae bacterium]|nr:50S ribosomal protein L4 [Anaerolineae bacterium]MCX8067595.1 50S ribosomal protein L4 [Anaerolineae bacterium]MDW7991870.1 50S ribosomal protein L4 [Anaerolineae bacterium]
MKVPVWNVHGQQVGEVELRPDIFEAPINVPLMHQALVRQLANARLGTHKTKTRGEVNRTTRKWYRQKGTGRARHGSRNAPIFVGGGIAHGPKPRSYEQRMPKKMRRAALRSALSVKASNQQIVVVDRLELPEPKTREMRGVLERLNVGENALILLAQRNEVVEKSARNLPGVKTLRAGYLNIRDLLKYEKVLMPLDAMQVIESILG